MGMSVHLRTWWGGAGETHEWLNLRVDEQLIRPLNSSQACGGTQEEYGDQRLYLGSESPHSGVSRTWPLALA